MQILQLIINEIFRQPPVLLGLIALLGLVLQGKPLNDVVKGTMLTAIGVVILTFGTDTIVSSIVPIQSAMSAVATGGAEGTALASRDIIGEYGGSIGIAMALAFLINIIVARFTKIKHIFLTGHMLFWFPYIFVSVAVENNFSASGIIIFSTICSAIYFVVMPAILTPFVVKVTGDRSFTLGHPAGLLAIIAALIARVTGDTSKSTEDINVPPSLGFFREIAITGSFVIFIVYIVVGVWLGKGPMGAGEDMSLITFSITNALKFGAGLTIMLSGVRMMIQQILPAFQGISQKLVPDSIPALDCPILFNYKPNAVIIGFVVAMITSTITIVIINANAGLNYLLLPLVITAFFECGVAAVLAEGQGGLRGAIIGTSVAGVVMVLFLLISIPVFSTTVADWMMIFGGNDFSVFGWLSNMIAKMF